MFEAVIETRRIPKSDSTLLECEDSTFPAVSPDAPQALDTKRSVGVADGATTYSFSREWSTILCEGMDACPPADREDLLRQLPGWQAQWQELISPRLDALPWFAAEKAQQGAYSTFLQLNLDPFPSGNVYGKWTALAVGDSCLIHVRAGKTLTCFPMQASQEFSAHPYLLPTRPDLNARVADFIHVEPGWYREGDEFLLMTDALAAWFLTELENNQTPFEVMKRFIPSKDAPPAETLQQETGQAEATALMPDSLVRVFREKNYDAGYGLASVNPAGGEAMTAADGAAVDDKFKTWVDSLRRSGEMKDDDVAFVYVRIQRSTEPSTHA